MTATLFILSACASVALAVWMLKHERQYRALQRQFIEAEESRRRLWVGLDLMADSIARIADGEPSDQELANVAAQTGHSVMRAGHQGVVMAKGGEC